MRGRVQAVDREERQPRAIAKSRPAVGHLIVVQFGADRFRRAIGGRQQHREKCSVAAAVIEQTTAAKGARQREAGLEPAAMAPRNQSILAEDLLGRVVAVPQRRVGLHVKD